MLWLAPCCAVLAFFPLVFGPSGARAHARDRHQGLGEDEREYRKHVRKLIGYHLPPHFAEVLTGRQEPVSGILQAPTPPCSPAMLLEEVSDGLVLHNIRVLGHCRAPREWKCLMSVAAPATPACLGLGSPADAEVFLPDNRPGAGLIAEFAEVGP